MSIRFGSSTATPNHDQVVFPSDNDLNILGDITLCCWAYIFDTDSTSSGYNCFMSKCDSSSTGGSTKNPFDFHTANDTGPGVRMSLVRSSDSVSSINNSLPVLPIREWHFVTAQHVAGVIDPRFYIDAQRIGGGPPVTAPALQAQGNTIANTTGTLTVVLPTHQANDILILCLTFWAPVSGPNDDIPTPSGWAEITTQLQVASGNGLIAYFWKRAASGAETNPACTRGAGWDTGTDTCFGGRAYVVRNCVTSGNPWDAANITAAYTTANQAFSAVTVSGSERSVIQFGNSTDDAAFAMTSSGWTTGTEDDDSTGTDCAFQTARKDNISTSTSADASTTSAPAQGAYAFLGISFIPVASGVAVTPTASAGGLLIGNRLDNLGSKGVAISHASIYNRILNPIEIKQAMYQGFVKRGLVFYSYLKGGGTTEVDLSGKGRVGTVIDVQGTILTGPLARAYGSKGFL